MARASAIGIGMVLIASPAAPAAGDEKDRYHLLNPTPRHLMREMSTDRPDTTESPYTVDAGHFQVELSFLDFTRDGDDDRLGVLPVNMKVGLTNAMDLQLVLEPYALVENGEAEGFGDTQVRLKLNLWGNDGGPFAIGFMPFVVFPTGEEAFSSGQLEGGLIVPAAIALPGGWSMGAQVEIDFLRDASNSDYGVALLHSATVSRDIAGALGGFVEYVGITSNDLGEDYEAYGSGGLTYGISSEVQLDVAVNVGLTENADDFNVFTGLSFRL